MAAVLRDPNQGSSPTSKRANAHDPLRSLIVATSEHTALQRRTSHFHTCVDGRCELEAGIMLHTPSLQFRPCWIPPMLDIRLSHRSGGARERGFQYNAPPFRLYARSQLLRAPSIVFPTTHRLSRAFTPLNARQRSLCTAPMLAFVLNILYNTSTSCCSTYTALLSRLCFHNSRAALRRK